jgi:hypothetical protein
MANGYGETVQDTISSPLIPLGHLGPCKTLCEAVA